MTALADKLAALGQATELTPVAKACKIVCRLHKIEDPLGYTTILAVRFGQLGQWLQRQRYA